MDVMDIRRRLLMQKHKTNLFNVFAPFMNPSDIVVSNATKRIFTPGTHCYGAAYSNYFNPSAVQQFEVSANGTMTVLSSSGYGVGYAVQAVSGGAYLVDGVFTGGLINACVYSSDGTPLTNNSTNYDGNLQINIPESGVMLVLIFRSYSPTIAATFSSVTLKRIA